MNPKNSKKSSAVASCPGTISHAAGEGPCLATYWVRRYWQLLVVRILTGISVGGTFPLVFSLVGDLFFPHQRAGVAAGIQLATGAGFAAGQFIAGFVGASRSSLPCLWSLRSDPASRGSGGAVLTLLRTRGLDLSTAGQAGLLGSWLLPSWRIPSDPGPIGLDRASVSSLKLLLHARAHLPASIWMLANVLGTSGHAGAPPA